MLHILAVSEFVACASASASTIYLTLRRRAHRPWLTIIPRDDSDVVNLRLLHGYNEHAFVLDWEEGLVWSDKGRGAVCYVERGNVWVVTGEPLAANDSVREITQKFVAYARDKGKLVAFLPTSERFAKAVAGGGFRIHKIAASPYFDLQKWDPKGNAAKGLRLGLNRARRAGISVEPVTDISERFRREVGDLCENWLAKRTSGMSFGWLFRLAPFRNEDVKKYFAARDTDGRLVGLVAASPIPARDGWYLEDVLRSADAPNGTPDLLVSEALRNLAAGGARLATLGTVPLLDIDADELTSRSFLLGRVLDITRKNLRPIYNINGLRCFKSRFVPSWWESEYIVVSRGYLRGPRTAIAILRVIFGESLPNVRSLISYLTNAMRSRHKPRHSLNQKT
jgi:phosphatidylglycerol lysyltransferase